MQKKLTIDHAHVLLDAMSVAKYHEHTNKPWENYDPDPNDPKTGRKGWLAMADEAANVLHASINTGTELTMPPTTAHAVTTLSLEHQQEGNTFALTLDGQAFTLSPHMAQYVFRYLARVAVVPR